MCVHSALVFCTLLATVLPFKHGDEPCALAHCINSVVASRGESILAALQPCLEASPHTEGMANGDASNEATPVGQMQVLA